MTTAAQSFKTPPKQTRQKRRRILIYTLVCLVLFTGGLLLGSLSGLGYGVRGMFFGATRALDSTTIEEMYGILQRDFDGTVNANALMNGANTGFAAATTDRHTRYMNPATTTAFMQRMQGNGRVGIGVELGVKNNNLTVIAPVPDSPAQQAGIRAGDIILTIDGVRVEDVSEEEAVESLRGQHGSYVKLTIQRGDQILAFRIVREPIVTPSVRSRKTDDAIGILTITTFDNNTARLAREAVATFRAANVRGIIIDMRDNPGGAVTAAQGVLGMWLPQGSIAMIEKRGDIILRTLKTESAPLVADVPTTILLNGNSASASEVVAGAMRDYQKAKIVGTQSFGKGSVQEIRPLRNGGALVFTVSRWWTPNGHNIDGVGIAPDVIVEVANTGQSQTEDSQLQAALNLLRS